MPEPAPDIPNSAQGAESRAHRYRLWGDDKPLQIAPESAKFGGLDEPILRDLCTFGPWGELLLAQRRVTTREIVSGRSSCVSHSRFSPAIRGRSWRGTSTDLAAYCSRQELLRESWCQMYFSNFPKR